MTTLDTYQQWMVRSNLEHIASGEHTTSEIVAVLRHNGYNSIADGVIAGRLEYLRGELRKECISMGELLELQSLADHIKPGDVELAEAAGIPEDEFMKRGADNGGD